MEARQMEVRKVEQPDGTLMTLEFISAGGEDFKESIKTWMQTNYPEMSFMEFFDRLEEFRLGMCRINMAQG